MKIKYLDKTIRIEGLSKHGVFYYDDLRGEWEHASFESIHSHGKNVDGSSIDMLRLIDDCLNVIQY